MQSDLRRENEAATVSIVERPRRFVELVSPGVPRHKDSAVVGLTDLDRRKDVSD